jgi:hypothetical protein
MKITSACKINNLCKRHRINSIIYPFKKKLLGFVCGRFFFQRRKSPYKVFFFLVLVFILYLFISLYNKEALETNVEKNKREFFFFINNLKHINIIILELMNFDLCCRARLFLRENSPRIVLDFCYLFVNNSVFYMYFFICVRVLSSHKLAIFKIKKCLLLLLKAKNSYICADSLTQRYLFLNKYNQKRFQI